jgi:hypothetical protein
MRMFLGHFPMDVFFAEVRAEDRAENLAEHSVES